VTGRVKVFIEARGFGFIVGGDGREYFFHEEDQLGDFSLKTGEIVTFEPVLPAPQKGPRAQDVALVPAE